MTGAHDRTVRLWNPSRLDPAYPPSPQAKRRQLGSHHRSMRYSCDDDKNEVCLDDLPRSLCIQTYHEGITHEVTAMDTDSACEALVTACDRALVIHDVVTGQCKRRLGSTHSGRINAVALGPYTETFLSASYDATMKVWDARNRRSFEPVQSLDEAKDSVTDVHVDRVSPHIIRTASVDGVVRSYDLRMGIVTCDDCHVGITSIAQAHDGQVLAVHGLDDATIRLLDLNNTTNTVDVPSSSSSLLLNTYKGHHVAGKYALQSVFTKDDAYLVTGSEDGTAAFYHVVTAQPVAILEGHGQPTCAVAASATKDNMVVVTCSYDGNAIVWAETEDYMKWQD